MTNNELLDIGKWVIEKVKEESNAECKIGIQSQKEVEIKYCKRKPEIIKEAFKKNLTLELFMNGMYSSQTSPDLRKSALETFISKSIENTKFIESDPDRCIIDPKYFKNVKKDLLIFDEKISKLPIEKRHEIASEIESSCLDIGGEKVISVETSFQDYELKEYSLTSNGFEHIMPSTYYVILNNISLQDKGDRKPESYYYTVCRNLDDLLSIKEFSTNSVNRATRLLGAKKISTEKLPVIIENSCVPSLLYGFITALRGRNIQQQRSFLANKKTEVIGSKYFTLVDDPFLIKGLGSRLYDYDGLPSNQMNLINEGKVENFYIDWYYSKKLKTEPTTGQVSNLIIPAGKKTKEELMKSIGRGILITDFIGGNSNSTTGDFSIGISGLLFENGLPIQSIAEMNIADNHLNFWKKLIDVGNDPWKYSEWVTPSLVFEDVVVSGI